MTEPPATALDTDLEFDPEFGALERAARGRPEAQYGAAIEPAQPPDWAAADTLAQALMTRTLDLRVLAHRAIAQLHLSGLPGFAAVLAEIRAVLEAHWDRVHPRLDPEDGLDPTQRGNALARLRDAGEVLRTLRDLPLARSARNETVTWRDIAVATGAAEPEPGRRKWNEAELHGLFAETDPARAAALRTAAGLALTEAAAIVVAFDARAGVGAAPDLQELTRMLRDIRRDLDRYTPATAAVAEAAGPDDPGGTAVAPAHAAADLGNSSLTRREDALRALELAARYFREHEPSSPVPLLIERARRLATMGFLDILRDLAPEGLGQAQVVAGPAPPA